MLSHFSGGRAKSVIFTVLLLLAFCGFTGAQTGTWTPVTTLAPHYNEGVMLLLTDGSIICKTSSGGDYAPWDDGVGNTWDKLTPVNGSYLNGTWSTIAHMDSARLYFSSQVLPDGRVYVCGGEYGGGGNWGEIYNPATNTWSPTGTGGTGLGHPFPQIVSDANSEILASGKILQASVNEAGVNLNYLYDPATNSYTPGPNCLRVDNEAVWVKLPDGSVLFQDNYGTTSERYIPATNTWVNDAIAPIDLFDPYGFEAGAAYLLPNGQVWFIGSTPHTLYYTPSGTASPGTWTMGPDIPGSKGAPDAASVMMPNGHVLLALSPTPTASNHFPGPTSYYEFDYTTNTFTQISAPGGGLTTPNGSYISNMLQLPDGNVMFCNSGTDQYYIYTPGGSSLAAGKPAINTATRLNCDTFQLTGTLFNGISEGAAYGDDWQMSTNYPIVRLTSGSNTYYATTYNWNRIGAVATGSLPDTCIFRLPAGLPVNTYSVTVIANGNPSAPFTINTDFTISPSSATIIVTGTTTFSDAAPGGTWSSGNTAIATISSTGVVTGVGVGVTQISYSLGASCYNTATVTVNPSVAGVITGTLTLCSGATTTLADTAAGGIWTSGNTGVATVGSTTGIVTGVSTGTAVISYTKSGFSATAIVTVNPPPAPIAGTYSVCASGGTTSLSDATPSGVWSSTNTSSATIGGTGIVSGVSAGTTTISYLVTSSCGSFAATAVVTVQALATAGTITGTATLPAGTFTPLSDAVSGGVWSCASTGIASVSPTGLVYGISPGTVAVSYTVTNICGSATTTAIVTVSLPACTPIISTIAGTGSTVASGDGGQALLAGLAPHDIQLDAANNIYIVDRPNHRIRKISTSGIITTVVGTGSSGSSGDGGLATAATMNNPNSMAFDKYGNMYIADGPNNKIRKVSTAGIITTFAGTGGGGSSGNGIPATSATFLNPYGVATDTAGNVYIADSYNNLVRKVNTSGIVTTIAGTGVAGFSGDGGQATAAKISWPDDIAVDDTGNVYISDGDNNRVRKISTTGIISTIVGVGPEGTNPAVYTGSFGGDGGPATAAHINQAFRIHFDRTTGNLYVDDAGNHRIRVVNTAGIISTVAGNGIGGFFGDHGPATAAQIYYPCGMSLDDTGNVYIADWGSNHVRKISKGAAILAATSGGVVICAATTTTLTGTPVSGSWSSSNAGIATVGSSTGIVTGVSGGTAIISYSVNTLCGLQVATATVTVNPLPVAGTITGTALVQVGSTTPLTDAVTGGTWSSESPTIGSVGTTGIVTGVSIGTATISYTKSNSCGTAAATKVVTVQAISGCNPIITTLAGTGSPGHSGDGGPATAAKLYHPDGVAVFGNNLYVGEVGSYCVRKIDLTTGIITTYAGNGIFGYSGDGGPASSASLSPVYDITVDTSGNLFIADQANYVVRKVNTAGIITTVAGNHTYGYSGDGGPATAAGLTDINGVSPDYHGNILIPDQRAYCVRKVNPAGIISTIAGIPLTTGMGGDGGPATSATFGQVTGVNVDTAGNIYVADFYNHRVRKINSSGVINTVAGNGIQGYTGDGGPATSAKIYGAVAVYADVWGNLFFGDSYNNVVRKVNYAGTISTIAGTGTAGHTGDGGLPTGATLNTVGPIVGDKNGHIFVCDYNNNCVRKISFPPSILNGPTVLCLETTITLTDSIGGGTWTSGATAIATVGASTGIVTGVSAGTAVIYYTANGCTVSKTVTVNGTVIVGPIVGVSSICAGTTTQLTDVIPGGTWSSSTPGVATISSSGLVTGVSAGTTTISYIATSCGTNSTVLVMTVNASATVGTINGTAAVCAGSTTTLSNAVGGGSWSSTNASVATVSTSGVVTGVSGGTALISYTINSGCGFSSASAVVTVTAIPAPGTINGTLTVCPTLTTLLSDSPAGGVWSSTTTGVATISTSGLVTGVATGTTTISYTITNGCGVVAATKVVTVSLTPDAGVISGLGVVCAASGISLTDAVAGGVWSSTATGVATVNTTGAVTGISAGTATISYTVNNSCGIAAATQIVTVNPLPVAGSVSGVASICGTASTTLSDVGGGSGTWSSTIPGVATVNAGGLVTGVSTGTTLISYTVTNGCGTAAATRIVTVNPLPVAGTISGTPVICGTATASMSDIVSGGAWSSTATGVAAVSTSGLVTGVSPGTTTISYTVTNMCGTIAATQTVTVNPLPDAGAISGTAIVCAGSATSLTDAVTGGVWSSTATGIATVSSTGLVTGASAGTATISFTVTNSCGTIAATQIATVNPLPVAGMISGTAMICGTATSLLSDAAGGGEWSSLSTGIATVGTDGVVTGVSTGTAMISYTVTNSCGVAAASVVITINPLPVAGAISGASVVCAPLSISLSDATGAAGGTWSSDNAAVATVGSTGVVTGATAGTAGITYTFTNICGTDIATTTVTVNTLPAVSSITGVAVICQSQTTALTTTTTGGDWSSSGSGTASVGTSGMVSGTGAGTASISYSVANGCGTTVVTRNVTVNASPAPISGSTAVCLGATIALSDAGGGTWSSSNANAAVGTTGMVTGMATGTAVITYTLPGDCFTTAMVSVDTITVPSATIALSPNDTVCGGTTVFFTASTANGGSVPGYLWSVNGALASTTGTSYSYVPAGNDTVTFVFTSSAACAVPASITRSALLTVVPVHTPTVAISAAPGDSLCLGVPVLFTAAGAYGGTSPEYIWYRNGVPVTTGTSYGFMPANGDDVVCRLVSNLQCRSIDTAASNNVTITIDSGYIPSVDIYAIPSPDLRAGQADTFIAVVYNGGPDITYQWAVNTTPIPGATSDIFYRDFFSDHDSVSCMVTSQGACPYGAFNSIKIHIIPLGVPVLYGTGDLKLVPNPNSGLFRLYGTVPGDDDHLWVEVTNMLGQPIYKGNVAVKAGIVDEHLQLMDNLANGMYLLEAKWDNGSKVFHFVVER